MGKPIISKTEQKRIAKERIVKLFKQAELCYKDNVGLANRYVTLARKIAMKVKIRIPKELKRKFCKHCSKFLILGENSQQRIRNGKIIISCFQCKKFTRIELKSTIKRKKIINLK
jgi:ribonuclease P protein subunit RPR2